MCLKHTYQGKKKPDHLNTHQRFILVTGYVWLDQYEISQGDNRRVIKLMEKENNKIRQKARKERNEEIRRLVSFVRRKDKRVIEHTKLLQAKVEENKRKVKITKFMLTLIK